MQIHSLHKNIDTLYSLAMQEKRRFGKYAKPFKFKKYDEKNLLRNCDEKWRRNEAFLWNSGIYCKANSANAAEFLRELVENVPYKVCSIQVDGGSEFMKNFEHACKELGIPLFVLPSAKPTYNSRIERSNRTFREEFYADLNEDAIVWARRELVKFLQKHNSYRPHASLHGLIGIF